ncbi:LysR family transcriptional regulator [Photobacterium chitinilyticum]|uniref:LysR family transcriptional regulator n=1 Tax=Photobacterium chitinilyticum TaxID=2485123 RepID=A0A3S3QUT5_9GAMM|nr:LysR family transcriptional regulator [Photobacterium chitinilyticum]RWX57314.1 LysR family transcriptional regulator [Photobacterium chitinilyticum]
MYNLDQLNMFVIAAKVGSFSACARKLGKVQSAVSQGISNLEIDLDVTLFDRSTRKPSLTDEGKHLLTFAEAILQQAYELESASKALTNNEETQLTLAIEDSLQVARFYTIIEQFSLRFPATSLNIMTMSSSDIIQYVLAGKANIGIILSDMTFIKEADICYIGNLSFVPIVCKKHPLASLSSVSPPDLIPHRQLMIKGVNGTHQAHLQPFSSQVWYGNDYRTLLKNVERGLGWTYMPRHLVEQDTSDQLHILPVTFDHKDWSIPVEYISPKDCSMGPAAKWLSRAINSLLD